MNIRVRKVWVYETGLGTSSEQQPFSCPARSRNDGRYDGY